MNEGLGKKMETTNFCFGVNGFGSMSGKNTKSKRKKKRSSTCKKRKVPKVENQPEKKVGMEWNWACIGVIE